MSSEDHQGLDRLHQTLAILRANLNQTGDWPDSADRLLIHLDRPAQSTPSSEEENAAVLSLIVSEVLNGVDIAERYPALFRRVLEDEELRQAFLDALEAMESGRQEAQPPLDTPQHTLDFLKAAAPQPSIEYASPAKWRMVWQQTIDQLESLFFPASAPQPAYRSIDDLEDPWFTLFRSDVEVAQAQLSVALEAIWMADPSDTLRVEVAVGFTPDPGEPAAQLPDLSARLTWGQYEEAVTITRRGRATFPRLPLNLVRDESTQRFTASLHFTLEPAL